MAAVREYVGLLGADDGLLLLRLAQCFLRAILLKPGGNITASVCLAIFLASA